MRKPLAHKNQTQYERPQQPWLCGMAAEGMNCPLGPQERAQCPLSAACVPVQESDRWKCGQPVIGASGCSQGPAADGKCAHLQCQPQPTLRTQRGRWVAACFVFALGLVLVVFNAQWRNEVLAPGPLSQGHAQIIHRENRAQRCATCHPQGNGKLWEWCQIAQLTGTVGPTQTELCLKCHEKTIPTAVAKMPHSLPAELLPTKGPQQLAEQGTIQRAGFSLPVGTKRHDLKCATCHREHHGNSPGLTALTDAQCQTCHSRTFHSFTSGHPEFDRWPQVAAAKLTFNHATHAGKHFVEAKQEFACSACHVDDPQKNHKLLVSFEQGCAKCHQGKILASTQEGIPFLILPTLDLTALRQAGHALPGWPAAADGDFDGKLPWMMRLLLEADTDPAVSRALAKLGPQSDFADLPPGSLSEAAVIATAIQRLWNELSTNGSAAIESRLLQRRKDQPPSISARLTQGLGPETIAAVVHWLPTNGSALSVEERRGREPIQPAAYREERPAAGSANPLRKPSPPDEEDDLLGGPPASAANSKPIPADVVPQDQPQGTPLPRRTPLLPAASRGVWVADDVTLTLRYYPVGHADPILAAWRDVAVADRSLSEAWLQHPVHDAKAQGLCVQCHQPDKGRMIWKAAPSPGRGFTKFAHRPHLIQPQLADCTHCHRLNASGPQYVDFQPGQSLPAGSDFAPLTKQACVQCHHQAAAGEHCTQCHRYHVDRLALP